MLRFFVWALAATSAIATTYYISPEGNDTAAGTSQDQPWQTLSRANTHAAYAPGDSILLARNSTWLGEVLSLANVAHVTIGAYGPETSRRPMIQVPRSTVQHYSCVAVNNAGDGMTVQDLSLRGCSTGVSVGANNASTDAFTIQRCMFADIRHPLSDFRAAGPAWAEAVSVSGVSSSAVTNMVVRNNIGIRMDTFFGQHVSLDGLMLDSNTVAQCGGNCVGMTQGTNLHMNNSVFLRDTPADFFLYGTTDIILGSLTGSNSVSRTSFNARGEFMGGPDGCALDFETASNGFSITDNTFYRSYGSGVMVFGHSASSTDWAISGNTFQYSGCVQPRSDQRSIAFMCPSGHKPSGNVANNNIQTCPGDEPYYINPDVPGCVDNVTFTNNNLKAMVMSQPIINLPPTATKAATGTGVLLAAVNGYPNATIRYTLDGSNPDETSPVLPADGYKFMWPCPSFAFNVRAYQDGFVPSVANGMLIEGGYSFGLPGGAAAMPVPGGLNSNVDHFTVTPTAASVSGWAVDTALPAGGVPPVVVTVSVDGSLVAAGVASTPRPDLPPAGVAPNADHGFDITLPAAARGMLQTGKHTVSVAAIGSPGSTTPKELVGSPMCVNNGTPVAC